MDASLSPCDEDRVVCLPSTHPEPIFPHKSANIGVLQLIRCLRMKPELQFVALSPLASRNTRSLYCERRTPMAGIASQLQLRSGSEPCNLRPECDNLFIMRYHQNLDLSFLGCHGILAWSSDSLQIVHTSRGFLPIDMQYGMGMPPRSNNCHSNSHDK